MLYIMYDTENLFIYRALCPSHTERSDSLHMMNCTRYIFIYRVVLVIQKNVVCCMLCTILEPYSYTRR